jgi:ABC-type maltose transport system permease subunit
MPGVVTFIRQRGLLLLLTGAFAALALNIAVPAVVLSLMALSRWIVSGDMDLAELEGKTA